MNVLNKLYNAYIPQVDSTSCTFSIESSVTDSIMKMKLYTTQLQSHIP